MPLCSYCSAISLDEIRGPNRDKTQRYHPSCLSLMKSAESGCQFCSIIWEVFDKQTKHKRDPRLGVSELHPGSQLALRSWGQEIDHIQVFAAESTSSLAPIALDPSWIPTASNLPSEFPATRRETNNLFDYKLDLFTYADDAAAWHGLVAGRPWASECKTIDEVLAKVLSWINICVATHSKCPKKGEALLPNRVIDVGPEDGSQEPRLLISKGNRGNYITLSHCWGGTVPLTTTTRNIESRKTSIAVKELPKTFNHAVIITRRLGVRYLWIDSLCIIQDSNEDWKRESTMMSKVFYNSFLTIAARGAANSNGGCFSLGQSLHSSCQFKYHSPDGSITGSMYVRSPYVRSSPIGEEPLETRAWALQERILSPRVIHFGSQQLFWECNEGGIREDHRPTNMNLDYLDGHETMGGTTTQYYWSRGHLDICSPERSLDASYPDSIYQRWYRIVEEYSRRKLTYSADKVAAILGLASLFQARTKDMYYSGLWSDDFRGGLLWRRGEYSLEDLNPILPEVPSWSWLRFNGPIKYSGSMTMQFQRHILAHTSILITASPKLGVLIYGQLIHTVYKPRPDHELQSASGKRLGRILFDYHPYDKERDCWCILLDNGRDPSALALELVQGQYCSFRKFSRIGFVKIFEDEKETERLKGTSLIYVYTFFDKETDKNLNHSTEPFWESKGEVIALV